VPTSDVLRLTLSRPVTPIMAGLCLARGTQKHPDRRLGEFELFFVRKGRLGIAEDGRDVSVTAGETLIVWPHRRHYGTEIVGSDCEFYWLHFVAEPAPAGEAALTVPQRARPARPARLIELLHRYLHDAATGQLSPAAGSLLAMLMLSEIAEGAPAPRSAENTLAARAEIEIARRFHLAVGTASIAKTLGCNPDHLGRIYLRAYGRSVMHAISERRVTEAMRLLIMEPGLPLERVARLCGCRNLAWFRRIFRRFAGTSPNEYRRAHAKAFINS
jgi:AraC-like DNA-binding protein